MTATLPFQSAISREMFSAVASRAYRSLDNTSSILRQKLTTRLASELERYREECAYPNWDAYDAEPLLPETISTAEAFLDKLPDTLQTPEAFVDPSGELFFEWAIQNSRAVVFVNQLGRLSFSLTKDNHTTFGYAYLPEIPSELRLFLTTRFLQ